MPTTEPTTLIEDLMFMAASVEERHTPGGRRVLLIVSDDTVAAASRLRDAAQRLRQEWQVAGDLSETDAVARGVLRALTRINGGPLHQDTGGEQEDCVEDRDCYGDMGTTCRNCGGIRRPLNYKPADTGGEPWTCPKCHRQTSADNKTCPSCGSRS